jgi:hypothetical protein
MAPRTGKTWNTVNHATAILDPAFLDAHRDERHLLKARFDALTNEGTLILSLSIKALATKILSKVFARTLQIAAQDCSTVSRMAFSKRSVSGRKRSLHSLTF